MAIRPSLMPTNLPSLTLGEFAARLSSCLPGPLPRSAAVALHHHYEELCRWAPRTALVGPAFATELFERHYAEALAALPYLPDGPFRLLDLGSGAGFPGLVLAAARPDCQVVLAEARERKWAFLTAAVRRAKLSSLCLRVTVGSTPMPTLPGPVAVVTARALRITRSMLDSLSPVLVNHARLILWAGQEVPSLGPEFVLSESRQLQGGDRRHLRVFTMTTSRAVQ